MHEFFLRRAWLVVHKDNTQHFTGVFLFCLGSFDYSVALLRLGRESHKHLEKQHWAMELFLFISSGVLLLAFILLWVEEENAGKHAPQAPTDTISEQNAYIVEHCAYIAHLLFYATFFLFHTPNPMYQPNVGAIYEAEMVEMVTLNTLNPLIPVTIEVT